jgi:hypothetical protein
MCNSCGCKTAKPVVENAQTAFKYAIEQGSLSAKPTDDNYAGKWMYMYSKEGKYWFKNIETRNYMEVKK